ncbi:MAG: hypothetical protein DHS20C15_01410 [Planctomycetota bacterium]|nr:MAG: hypothetical protein DHS20C15_01410 [Planctomycetota bacterium]
MLRCLALPLVLLSLACATTPSSRWPAAAGTVENPALATLSVSLWDTLIEFQPLRAGYWGDADSLALLPDLSPEARATQQQRWENLRTQADAIKVAQLSEADATTLQMARRLIHEQLTWLELALGDWLLSPGGDLHTRLWNLAEDQPLVSAADVRALQTRWAAMPALVNQRRLNLLSGLEAGRVANHRSVSVVVEQLAALLAQPTEQWALAQVGDELPRARREGLRAALLPGLEGELRPALRALRDTLTDEVLPRARPDSMPGLVHLPGGARDYARLAELHTGLPLTPQKIHAIGRNEIARIRDEMLALGREVFHDEELLEMAQLQARIRNDPSLFFDTREQVEALAVDALARASVALEGWFGRRPVAGCDVVRIAPHEEAHSTIAYYRGPPADGSGPGRYFINTSEPSTRPRYDAEVLAFHEAIPGHHLQIAIAQELPGAPLFQRNTGTTAFVEGWALYTERLCDEMGLYSGDLDRLGMLSFDAWRASRLVVDTGLHAMGWSRDEAITYLGENTLLSANNVIVEVDRYIANPGQALGYKLGQLEILRLRSEARAALGERFAIERFHDVVLSAGAVTLQRLQERVRGWIAAEQAELSRPTPSGTW